MAEGSVEEERNALLRRVDWRFLLPLSTAPRLLGPGPRRESDALRLVCEQAPDGFENADLAVIGRPTAAALDEARRGLRSGGQVVCLLRRPGPGALRRARRQLRAAGFGEVSVHWPGPLPDRLPHYWLPIEVSAAASYLLARRPARRRQGVALQVLWRTAARWGAFVPLCLVARAPEGAPADAVDDLGELVPDPGSWLLMTGGSRSINKVVALAFAKGESEPAAVVKFARVAEAEAGLAREAEALTQLERERPELAGVPRVIGRGRRAGRLAIVERPVEGPTLISELRPETAESLSLRMTRWLIDLAGLGSPEPMPRWWERLVEAPVDRLAADYGAALLPGTTDRALALLQGLGDLPPAFEHRDCSPWNAILGPGGEPVLLDWESAEPRGLPGLDLVYFLANAGFVMEKAFEDGRTRESYVRMLDPSTSYGAIAARCIREYVDALGISAPAMERLRLLCWIVHCRSDFLHLAAETVEPPDAHRLRAGVFLGLLEEEMALSGA